MRGFSSLFQRVRLAWFRLKLGWLLAQFLVWFGFKQYLFGRVFLVSFCWLVLAVLLVVNQLLIAYLPNTRLPDLRSLTLSPTQQHDLTWSLVSLDQLEERCSAFATASQTHHTHQSLMRNVALCWLTQGKTELAQNAWNQARAINPNH